MIVIWFCLISVLFTNIPLAFTFDLRKVYDEKLVEVKIPRKELKELFLLYNIHFLFNEDIYTQFNCVAMGSPLSPFMTGIFMVELEIYWFQRFLTNVNFGGDIR